MTYPPASGRGSRVPPGDARGWPPADAEHAGWPAAPADDGWGPSTAVYSGSAHRAGRSSPPDAGPPTRVDGGWTPAGPLAAREQRATRAAERQRERAAEVAARPAERGLPWWGALLVLIVIAGIGGLIDTIGSDQNRGGFNIGIVVASIVAILAVRRSHMFPVVIAPPIIYSAAAVIQLYVRSSGLHDKKVVLDAAANYLVYGFPAIASATAAVLIIAGIRLIARK